MESNQEKDQSGSCVIGCSFIILGIGTLGLLFCLLAFLYSESFGGGLKSIEGWIFKAAFVFIIMFCAGPILLALCGVNINTLKKE